MSSFVVQRAEILRDQMLELMAGQYEAFGEEIDTSAESDAYRYASAFALCLEVVMARQPVVEAAIFPDTALTTELEHHASVYGLERKPASAARLTVQVSNGGGGALSYPLAGETLNHSDGTKYLPINASTGAALTSITTDAGGLASIVVEAQTAGTIGNRAVGSLLVWSSAPSGLLSQGEVTAVTRSGAAAELDADLAARLLAYLRARPAAGNCADWQSWALEVTGISQAYVYPATNPAAATTNATPGAVTVVVLVDRASNNGIASAGDEDNVFGYIEGDRDTDGNTLDGDGRARQKRFCALDADDITVMAATPNPQPVHINVTVRGETVPAWTPMTTDVGCTSTLINVTVNPLTIGVEAGQYAAVTDPSVEGFWEVRKIIARDNVSITLESALTFTPGAGVEVRRAWSGWNSARDAVRAIFQALGPGDYPTGPLSRTRFPDTSETAPDVLYTSSLVAAVVGVARAGGGITGITGVVAAAVTTPAADVQAAPLELVTPQEIRFTPSN